MVSNFMINGSRSLVSYDLRFLQRFDGIESIEIWNYCEGGREGDWMEAMKWLRGIERLAGGRTPKVVICDGRGEKDGRFVCFERDEVVGPER